MLIGAGIGIPFQQNVLARLLGSAEFFAPLTHSAIPTRAAFGTTGTFTRATTSTWPNNDGYMVTGVAGEIGFVGARRIYNLWTTSSVSLANGANKSLTLSAGTYAFSMGAGTGTATFSGTGGATGTLAASASGRVSVNKTISAGTFVVTASVADLADLQVESLTAQTTQTAGEYVSVGVESAPYYHGSMVDGVKCFPTDLSGNPIAASTLLGYVAEGAGTNLCLQSQNLGTTWIPANTTVVIDSAVAPDGTTTADKFYPTTTGANRYIYQPITETIASYTKSFYAKSAGMSWVVPLTFTGAALGVWFDVTNGVVGTVTGGYTATIKSVGNGWYRCTVTGTAPISAIFGIGISDADNSTTATTSGTNGIYLWGMQSELGSFASSYIPTTTIAVARNADVLTYSSAGNTSASAGWVYFEATVPINNGAPQIQIDDGSSDNRIMIDDGNSANGGTRFFIQSGGAVQANIGDFSSSANIVQKRCVTWAANYAQSSQGGLLSAADTSVTTPVSFTQIGVGGANGVAVAPCTIRNVRIGQRQLSASELGAITS